MATHFSANQYDQAFAAQRLQNWEVPKKYKERPSTLDGFTQCISNDRGHILPGIPRSQNPPWGEFTGTWDMTKPPRTRSHKKKASKDAGCTLAETKPDVSEWTDQAVHQDAGVVENGQMNSAREESPKNFRSSPQPDFKTCDQVIEEDK